MLRNNTIVLVVILLFLIAFTIVIQRSQPGGQPQTDLPTPSAKALFSFTEDQIVAIQMDDANKRSLSLTKNENGEWILNKTSVSETDQTKVISLVRQFTSLQTVTHLELVPALEDVGLDKPTYTIHLTLSAETKLTLKTGSASPTNSGYYVQVDGNPVELVNKEALDFVFGYLSSPPQATPTPSPTPVTPTPAATLAITPTPTQ